MLKINVTMFLVGTLLLAGTGLTYLNSRVETLKTTVKEVKEQSENNLKSLNELKESVSNLQTTYNNRDDNRAVRDESNTKMRKDAKRGDVVAAKPKLVEKKINDSFNSFAQGLEESTR